MTDDQRFILVYVDDGEHLSYEGALRKAELRDKRAADDFYNSVQGNVPNFSLEPVGNGHYIRMWETL